jgi:DNA-directed RNA polymerase subunit RPC12/RpoP
MGLTLPDDMDKLVYFTRRKLEPQGRVIAWVDKGLCPKCKKGLMGKPKDPKTGRPKIRATEYVCDSCGHSEEKKSYEETLQANAVYTCPHCNKDGESTQPFKRKLITGVQTLRIVCQHCGGNIDITKKMKEPKKKKR